jgi:hypothetical protein
MTYDELAEQLDLDVDDLPICLACLSFVSFAIDSGDAREITSTVRKITPDLWAEGLEQPVKLALQRADAREALADVERNGPYSGVVRAVVRRLASDLSARAKGDLLKMGFQPWPPPSLG